MKTQSAAAADSLSNACALVLCVTDAHILSVDGGKVTGTVANATTALNVSGIVPIANGGTGSSTQNFVDLSSNQPSIFGVKTFRNNTNFSGMATFNNNAVFNNADPVTINGSLNVGGALAADVASVSELSAIGGIEAGQFSGNGSGLTNLDATNVTTGTLGDARLSTNVATLNGPQIFAGLKHFAGGLTGNGSGLTELNGSNITSGTIADSRLSTNIATLSGAQTFTGAKNFAGGLSGDGSGLTNLNLPGMGFSGKTNGLTPDGFTKYGGPSGFRIAGASTFEPSVLFLLPNRTCTAMNLAVMLVDSDGDATSPGANNSRSIDLRRDRFTTPVSCTISNSATSCNSGPATALINAGSPLSIRILSVDGEPTGDVGGYSIIFGWECR